jgi:hypothetical protein
LLLNEPREESEEEQERSVPQQVTLSITHGVNFTVRPCHPEAAEPPVSRQPRT